MQQDKAFESIRPYNDNEVHDVIEQLLQEPHFQKVLSVVYPDRKLSEVMETMQQIKTIREFQKEMVYYYLCIVKEKTITDLSISGMEHLDPSQSYLFMSNHRDIVLDSALLNFLFVENNRNTTEIAIGSNLLILPWIEMLVKLNKSFVVKRNLPVKEMLDASKELSSYIQYTLLEKSNSIWIAQKEGRTKDGNDSTHSGLLKMIHMSSNQPTSEYFRNLKLVPVSISYEVEPCDGPKTAELYARLRDGNYVKDPKEDLLSMSGGLLNFKGHVHFHFDKPLDVELDELDKTKNKNDQYIKLAQIIDEKIHLGFKLYPGNYIAYDILSGKQSFKDNYSTHEFEAFNTRMEGIIKDIDGNKNTLKQIYLGIYANPLINKYYLDKIPIKQ